jgi:hypothetical protein
MRTGNSFFVSIAAFVQPEVQLLGWVQSPDTQEELPSFQKDPIRASWWRWAKAKQKNKIVRSSLWDGNNVNSLTLEIQTFAMIRFEPGGVDATLVLNVSKPLMKLSKTFRCLSCEIWRRNLIHVNELFDYGNNG